MQSAGIVKMINGPEAFTPDGEFILGESDVRGFFVATGFCAHGIAGAGGVGKVMAEWIAEGEPELDVWKMDIRRFGKQYRSRTYALARAVEIYSTYYDIHYPNEERSAGRPLKTAPTYARLEALGAVFGEKSGWERPNWFGMNEDTALEHLRPGGWAGEHWSTAIAAEALATRERAGLFDESSFAKIEVAGPGASAFLQRTCANDVDVDVGRVVYTQMLNRRGGIESDFTATRLEPTRYLIVTGTAFGNHDIEWIRKQLREDDDVVVARRDRKLGVLRALGTACEGHPRAAHAAGTLERRVPVHARSRDRRGRRALCRPPRHVRGRARVGALRIARVRGPPVGHARRGRPRA